VGLFLAGRAAWAAGTALAVTVAWFGANVVINSAGGSPGMPVINARPPAAAGSSPGGPSPGGPAATSGPGGRVTGSQQPSAPAVPQPPVSAAPAGQVRTYTMTGGRVTLLVTKSSAELVTAAPEPGYSVKTWTEQYLLRVDFSSGSGQGSSLIAAGYEETPAITVSG
jgi:hypothetical protein